MDIELKNKFNAIAPLVGGTPLIAISYEHKGKKGRVLAKAEYYNLTGSIKDRVALHILRKAYESGEIKKTDTICEATSGNTGIAFSAVGRYLGHNVVIYMPDWMSAERIHMMESFGAKVELVSAEEGGFLGSIEKTQQLAAKGGVFLPRQFSNEENCVSHYLMTGEEIARQLKSAGIRASGVVAGVGTGGTVMGIGRRLRDEYGDFGIFPLEPKNSPTLSTGYKVGKHRIYGISDEFIPEILKLDETDGVVSVDDGDAIAMARKLSEELGIGVGVSSGANFLGSVIASEKTGGDIVTVFADDNKKYLSTDYSKKAEYREDYITKDIRFTGIEVVR